MEPDSVREIRPQVEEFLRKHGLGYIICILDRQEDVRAILHAYLMACHAGGKPISVEIDWLCTQYGVEVGTPTAPFFRTILDTIRVFDINKDTFKGTPEAMKLHMATSYKWRESEYDEWYDLYKMLMN